MSDTVSSLAQKLRPYWLRDVGASGGGIVAGSGGGGLTAHALNGPYHTGELDPDQAPWAVTDTEFAIHAANPDAHHARQHSIISSSDHTVTGSQYQIVGLPAANTLGLLMPSATPAANTLVRTDSSSAVRLVELTVTDDLYMDGVLDFGVNTLYEDATYLRLTGSKALLLAQNIGNANWTIYNAGGAEFRGNVDILAGGDLYVAGSGFYAGNPVLFVDSSGGNVGILRVPDPQFALDVNGPARAQYFIGPHAIQLKDALLIAHYDGPERGPAGEANGHFGQVATVTGDVVFRPGKFNKAVEITEPYSNILANPSFETSATGWASYATGAATGSRTRTDEDAWDGYYSYKIVKTGGSNATRWGATTTYAVTSGQAYSLSVRVRVADAVGQVGDLVVFRTETNVTAAAASVTAVGNEWVELIINTTATATGTATIYVWIANCDTATIYIDAVQVTATGAARPFWGGAAGRAAGNLNYSNLPMRWNRCTIMAWVRLSATAGALGRQVFLFEVRADNDNRYYVSISNTTNMLLAHLAGGGTSTAPGGTSVVTAGAWHHVALVVNGTAVALYLDGIAEDTNNTLAGSSVGMATAYIGAGASGNRANGMIDDFAIINDALDAAGVRAVYESNAPVFAESSVWSWRATPKGLVWADDEGLWMRDVAGNPVLGIYGGEAATKSWGGFGLAVGDLVIGRNAVGSAALMWDQSTGKFGWYGGGDGTPQVEISTGGEVVAGSGAVRLGNYGLRAYTPSNALGLSVSESGIFLQAGGPRATPFSTATASRVRWNLGELFGADAESYLDSFSNTRYMRPTVLRSFWDGAELHGSWLELSAGHIDASSRARIVVADGYWLPNNYSNPSIYNTTNVIDLQASLVMLSATNLRLQGPATNAGAVGAYAGKVKVNINGTDRWIPYYAS